MQLEPQVRPQIGIMARVRFAGGEFLGKQGELLREYLRLADRGRFVACVFDPADVDTETAMMAGYVLVSVPDGAATRIIKTSLRLPYVVYDQLLSRRYESARSVVGKREFLRAHAVIFNDGYFNKWQVYEWLSDDRSLVDHLPKTAKLTIANFLYFCERYPLIFVKPIHGSLGRGIIKLIHQEEGWQSMLRLRTSRKEKHFSHNCEEVYDYLATRTNNKTYVLQEGVRLFEIDDRPLDIRVLMQKNERGEWKGTKTYLRLAAKGEFVSNLSSGGEAFAVHSLNGVMPPDAYKRMRKQVKQLANQLPVLIEQKAKRTLGELGLDFGVDKTGHVYLLEVNSKPRKNVKTTRGSAHLVERALERPLLYALRLYASIERDRSASV